MRLSGLGLPAICGPVARLSAAQAGKKPQQYHLTAYSPGCGVNALPGLRTIGNLRYCSPGTRIAQPPGEEHGVEEFPGGDAAHLSGLPDGVLYAKKKPVLAYELFLKYGGEGGIDSLRSPSGQIPRRLVICPTGWHQLSNPGRGFSSPRRGAIYEKKPVLAYELFLKYGGEGGIRTPDTLPYTHFPGVLLQPLGHLTILSFPLLPGTGANLGKYVSPVNQLF